MKNEDMDEIKEIIGADEDQEYDFTDTETEEEEPGADDDDELSGLLSVRDIVNLLNTRAKAKGTDSMKALQEIMSMRLGKERTGNKVEIKFLGGKEISVEDWNTRVEDYLNWEMSEVVILEDNIKNNPLLSSKEKEVILGINKQALLSIVSIFKYSTHTRESENEIKKI